MPVSSLIIRVRPDSLHPVVKAVSEIKQAAIHETRGQNIVVVTQTKTKSEDKKIWDRIEHLEGVLQTDLIYHNFEDIEEAK
jgi:nitrate reductase NapAB chaperone NapD